RGRQHAVAAADLRLAGGRAAVAAVDVAVVALLAGRDDAVAAPGRGAVRVTAVAVGQVPVVATLAAAGLEHAVATEGRHAGRRAAIAVDGVAVVTLLARRGDAVAAAGRLAVRVTSVAIDEIAVVARLATFQDAVATGPEEARCIRDDVGRVDVAEGVTQSHRQIEVEGDRRVDDGAAAVAIGERHDVRGVAPAEDQASTPRQTPRHGEPTLATPAALDASLADHP